MTDRITFTIPHDEALRLRAFCQENNVSMSSLICQSLKEHYDQEQALKLISDNQVLYKDAILALANGFKNNS